MSVRVAKRVADMPAYIFSEINAIKEKARAKGMDLISLAIGDPDKSTPVGIINSMKIAVEKQTNHQYSPYEGTKAFRSAAANFMKRRFGVSLNPDKEIIALVGSKEGLAHLPLAFVNPGDAVLYPEPGFPMYQTTTEMAGGRAVKFPLVFDNKFLPDMKSFEAQIKKEKPRYIILNYPHNPTAATCPLETLEEILELANKYDFFIAYDNAYSEIYFDENQKPISALQVRGAKERVIEFHTLSKTFNMTGWRMAFAAGNEVLCQGLLKVKTNIDSGPFPATQEASVYALDNYESLTSEIRRVYRDRLKVALNGLNQLKIEYLPPSATFYVWASVPNGESSMQFCKNLIEQQGVVITPGLGFGESCDGYFRLALTVDMPRIEEAMRRMAAYLKH